jgi:hypothetical protein
MLLILQTLLIAEQHTSWPEAFATVGTMFGLGFIFWVLFRNH